MIQIKNLYKKFEEKILFENYNLQINKGDFIIFSGKSGCGKTTLLNMIGALEPFDNGKIIVDGLDISKKSNHLKYFRYNVGFLFQNFVLIENKTVLQNLNLISKNMRENISIDDVLNRVGLKDKKNNKVFTLSGGEQQRIALARLMLKKCNLILADEPTGSLDSQNANEVMSILKNLNKEGKTVIVVTHDEKIKNSEKKVIHL